MAATKHILLVAMCGLFCLCGELCAQSLFNNRLSTTPSSGNLGGLPSSSMFSNPFGQSGSTFGAAGQPSSGFIGRGSQAGGIVGRRQASTGSATEQRANEASRRREVPRNARPENTSGETASAERATTSRLRQVIRPRHRIAFDYTVVSSDDLIEGLGVRFADFTTKRPEFGDVRARIGDARAVVLTGTVPSNETRRLAELVVRLEPGVRAIRNELVVASRTDDAAPNNSQRIE